MDDKGKLNPLPASDSEYFTKYNADTYKVEMKKLESCKHDFRYVTASEIECPKCGMGLRLGIGDKLLDGHLYHEDLLVI